jgi:nucleoside-diphosphate-sugar epimerase
MDGAEGSLPERVLVLGATSLIGRFALPRLAAAGVEALAISRRGPSTSTPPALQAGHPPDSGGGRWVRADLQAPDLLLPQAPAALSLSPIWLLPGALPALERAEVRRVVAFSSTSVFTKADSPEPEERAVAARLAAGEAELERFCAARGIGWTVLRPTMIYAEGLDQNVSRLARLIARFGVFPLAGEGGGRRQPVHADDLAGAALEALRRPATAGRSYDLPGGETLTYREMVGRIFEGLGRRPRVVTVPPGLWRLGLRMAGARLPGVNVAMGARMGADLVFDDGAARAELGWAPRPVRPEFAT